VLLDTNVVVSALLFGGTPRVLLRTLSSPEFELWTSRPLLRELATVLSHQKLQSALARTGFAVESLVQAYASQAFVAPDASLPEVTFASDPGDAPVVAAALAAKADWLVTGDRHLLEAKEALGVEVLRIGEALERAAALSGREETQP
jgi:hypothetical protein